MCQKWRGGSSPLIRTIDLARAARLFAACSAHDCAVNFTSIHSSPRHHTRASVEPSDDEQPQAESLSAFDYNAVGVTDSASSRVLGGAALQISDSSQHQRRIIGSEQSIRNVVQIALHENLIASIGLAARRRTFSQIDASCIVTLISCAAK